MMVQGGWGGGGRETGLSGGGPWPGWPLTAHLLSLPALSSSPFSSLLPSLQLWSLVTPALDKQMVGFVLFCLAWTAF